MVQQISFSHRNKGKYISNTADREEHGKQKANRFRKEDSREGSSMDAVLITNY